MISFFLICFVAGLLGSLLQGMIGIGTGVVIVPLLSFLLPHYGIPETHAMHCALATSMAAIAVNSVSALKSHYQRGNIRWGLLKKLILFSLTGAMLGALLANQLSGALLRSVFGVFMLCLAIYLLRKKPMPHQDPLDLTPIKWSQLAIGGLSIGTIASIVGSGGGVLMVPFLHHLKLPMRYAVGTATLVGFPVAIAGAITYASSSPIAQPIQWPALIAISLAGMLGAPLGVKLSVTINSTILLNIFACLMVLVALNMIVF